MPSNQKPCSGWVFPNCTIWMRNVHWRGRIVTIEGRMEERGRQTDNKKKLFRKCTHAFTPNYWTEFKWKREMSGVGGERTRATRNDKTKIKKYRNYEMNEFINWNVTMFRWNANCKWMDETHGACSSVHSFISKKSKQNGFKVNSKPYKSNYIAERKKSMDKHGRQANA